MPTFKFILKHTFLITQGLTALLAFQRNVDMRVGLTDIALISMELLKMRSKF